jgi:hypothetical protein
VAQPPVLAGRADEQAALRGLLVSLGDGMSGALVLRGEPGVGKTALLEYLAGAAPGTDFAAVPGVEAEAGFGFAGLHRLLVPYLGRLDRLPAPQRLALGTALGLVDGTPGTPFFIGLAALTVLAEAAQERPLVCVFDDAQWLDPESLEVLAFIARRVFAERLGLVFGVREPPRLAALEGIPELRLSGLSPEVAADLLLTLAPGRVDPHVAAQRITSDRLRPWPIAATSSSSAPQSSLRPIRTPGPAASWPVDDVLTGSASLGTVQQAHNTGTRPSVAASAQSAWVTEDRGTDHRPSEAGQPPIFRSINLCLYPRSGRPPQNRNAAKEPHGPAGT